MRKTAIVDIDNTLWPFSDAFFEELRKINAAFPPQDQWRRYDLWEGYCSAEAFQAAIDRIHRAQDSDRHRPYPEARRFLRFLRAQGFRVVIASHRSTETRPPTERWLKRHGLAYDELHLSFDKTVLFGEAEILVDDSPLTLAKAIERNLLATGLRFPWNSDGAAHGARLFGNLDEVRDCIREATRDR